MTQKNDIDTGNTGKLKNAELGKTFLAKVFNKRLPCISVAFVTLCLNTIIMHSNFI